MSLLSRFRLAAFLCASLAACLPAVAPAVLQDRPGRHHPARAGRTAWPMRPTACPPAAPLWVGLQIAHQPGWHTYWKNAGDSGLPTELAWSLPAGVSGRRHRLARAEQDPDRHPGQLRLREHRAAAGAAHRRRRTSSRSRRSPAPPSWTSGSRPPGWCAAKECIPEDGEFLLKLPVQGSTALQRAPPSTPRSPRSPPPLAQPGRIAIDGRQAAGAPRRPARRRAGQDPGVLPRNRRGDPHRGRARQGLDASLAGRRLDRHRAAGRRSAAPAPP